MQYLMVLFLIFALFVLAIGLLFGASFALGELLHSRSGRAAATGPDSCAQCHDDRDWHDELPFWKRNLVAGWWVVNRFRCAARGCN